MNVELTPEQVIVVSAALDVRESWLEQQQQRRISGFKLPGMRHYELVDELANVRAARAAITGAS